MDFHGQHQKKKKQYKLSNPKKNLRIKPVQRYLGFRYAIMILRLVYSFFFFSLVTGNQRFQDLTKTARMGECQNKICICQDPPDLPNGLHHASSLKITEIPLRVVEGHYGYPAHGLISANPVVATQSRIEYVSDDDPSHQVPRPVQYVDEEGGREKTICFTPSMVHKMIKAALEYVSKMPSDINNIIDRLDQELNRMTDQDTIEDNAVKTPLYPLDSKTVFQMLDKPRSEKRTNVILKYELPSVKEPHCREALEKLIEIAYTAYTELEKHPQCRDYLYNFASQQPGERPAGHLDRGPDLKSLVASILDQVDKHKPDLDISPDNDRYGDMQSAELPTPKTHNGHNIPEIHEYTIRQKPKIHKYNIIHKYSVPEGQDYNGPPLPEYNTPKHSAPEDQDYNGPQVHSIHKYGVPEIQDYNAPQVPEYNIHKYDLPGAQDYNLPQITDYFKINEYKVPKPYEYDKPEDILPEIHEYTITQNHEYVPKVLEYTITENQDYIPQIQDINIPPPVKSIDAPETRHEPMKETKPMQPEDTMNTLAKLLQSPDSGNPPDHLLKVLKENQSNFHPKIYKILVNLLGAEKQNNIPRFNDIFLLLLDSQRNPDWPWSDRVTEHLLSHLIPDRNSNLDPRIVDIILNVYKTRPNDKQVENILSLLRPIKKGNLDSKIGDLILRLISLHQNNSLRPEFIDTLLKLLKPAQNGIGIPKEVDIVDNLSRFNEVGISPDQLNGFFALLKPYANGHTDHRPVDIVYFLLNEGKNLNPKHSDFMLSFLYPEHGILETRRVDVVDFLLNNLQRYPKQVNILFNLLEHNEPSALNSRFLEILLFLNSNGLLTPDLVETITNLLADDVTGQLDDNQVKNLFFQLAPFKQSHPKLVVDVLTLLNQGGLHGNIAEWLEKTNNNVGVPNRDSSPPNLNVLPNLHDDIKGRKPDNAEYRIPDEGYTTGDVAQQMPDNDFVSIFKWLDSQGLLTPDEGSNTDLVNKILNIMEVGQRELGVVELTYMLKHEKPLIYQPVYYVKYRLPILSFISNMKTLLLENPNLNADPMKLLQELIVVSNVTEVSPNLQGYPKEEILKLTFNDGDLVQAKILDEQNLSLNDQIKYVHNLNSDISPEEILQLNKMNEAKYFPKLVEVKGVHPDQLTIKEVDRYLDVPPVQYRHIEPAVARQMKTQHHQTYIARSNQKQDALHHNNALPRLQN